VEPAKPSGAAPALVPGRASAPPPKRPTAETLQYWDKFYQHHNESAYDLHDKVTLLNFNLKTQDVEAIVLGYLRHHQKNAETWMYEALALAMKMNKASEKDVKLALWYAADMAERVNNPNELISVADLLFIHGYYYDRVGRMLDKAADKVPHRAEPLIMSINLAQRTKDPRRMAAAVDRLLSLGWPGNDERIRSDSRKQVEMLAKSLREDGRAGEADTMLAKLTESETRDLFVRLTWVGDAGLDLAVEEPLGATACFKTPRTVFGGAIVKDGYGAHPEEVYVCPRGFDGTYTIRIETSYNNPNKPALQANLEIITHEGTKEERKESQTIELSKSPTPVVIQLTGGRRKVAMPFLSPAAMQPPPVAARPKKPKTGDAKTAAAKDARPKIDVTKPALKAQAPVTTRPQ
jgi:hypothetical protein